MSFNELIAWPALFITTGPLVAFGLLLLGPVVLVLTIVAALAVLVLLVALAGAIVASPYLLYRHLARRRRSREPQITAAAAPLGYIESRRVAA